MTARVTVRLTPRASRDQVGPFAPAGDATEVLHVRVTAPPVDGRANAALERLLARTLRVPRSAVRVSGGHAARIKRVEIEGLSNAQVRDRLPR